MVSLCFMTLFLPFVELQLQLSALYETNMRPSKILPKALTQQQLSLPKWWESFSIQCRVYLDVEMIY
jgi:hypothetical protein